MKVVFISSANKSVISPIVKTQGLSLSNLGISIEYYGVKGTGLWGYLGNLTRLKKFLNKTKPDLLHAHYSLSGILASFVAYNKPLVVSLMGSDTDTGKLQLQITKFFIKYVWSKVIVKSKTMQTNIGNQSILVIPNGVNIDIFKPLKQKTLKKHFSFSEKKTTILFLADPNRKEKNYFLAKSAFEMLNTSNAELKVLYSQNQKSIPDIMNAADIILLTSTREGSPNVIKEAMACNRPIVATDVGDIKWLLGNEPGHFISGFEPEILSEKIKQAILFSTNYGQTNGRKRIKELGLDSESIAKKIISVYDGVIKKQI